MELGSIISIISSALAVLSVLRQVQQSTKAFKEIYALMERIVELQVEVVRNTLGMTFLVSTKLVELLAKAIILLSGGIFRAANDAMKRVRSEERIRETALAATVAGMMVRSKAAANAIGYAALFGSTVLYLATCWLTDKAAHPLPITFFSLLVVAIYVNQTLLEYRIRRGFYGFNPYEAKEVIQFILLHSDTSDFSDSDGLKSVIPEADMDSIYDRLHDLLPEQAS
jgi:hypothetical protein